MRFLALGAVSYLWYTKYMVMSTTLYSNTAAAVVPATLTQRTDQPCGVIQQLIALAGSVSVLGYLRHQCSMPTQRSISLTSMYKYSYVVCVLPFVYTL